MVRSIQHQKVRPILMIPNSMFSIFSTISQRKKNRTKNTRKVDLQNIWFHEMLTAWCSSYFLNWCRGNGGREGRKEGGREGRSVIDLIHWDLRLRLKQLGDGSSLQEQPIAYNRLHIHWLGYRQNGHPVIVEEFKVDDTIYRGPRWASSR